MPELPEVETIRTQLADRLIGRKIVGVDVRLPKMFEGDTNDIVGAKITDVQRRAKIVILKLDNGKNIVVHLKMTGQLIFGENQNKANKPVTQLPNKKKVEETFVAETISFSQGIPFAGFSLPAKTTHVIFNLDPPSSRRGGTSEGQAKLFFNDMRQFGWVKIITNDELRIMNEKHGPEPFDFAQGKPTEFTVEYLTKICSNWGRPIKILLMEQSKIAGIGNIYANEALWEAGISPMKRGREVTKIKELYEAIKKVLEMGLKYGGSSAADEAFVNAEGKPGKMQEHFVVYQKDGKPCPRCGKTITRSKLSGRGTFFCPKCQK